MTRAADASGKVVVGLLATAMATSSLTSFCLSVLAPDVLRDLAMSRSQLGWVIAAVSAVTAVTSVGMGALADRYGGRVTLVSVFALGALALLGVAVAPAFGWLLAATVFAGACQGAANPTTNRLVVDTLGPGKRGLVTGVKQSGEMFAVVGAGALLPASAAVLGWRGAVAVTAIVPAVAIAITLALVHPPRTRAAPVLGRAAPEPLSSDVWWLTAYMLVMGISGSSMSAYLPLYAQQAVGVSITTAGLVLALVGVVAIFGRIVWSRRAERAAAYAGQFMALSALSALACVLFWAASYAGPAVLWLGAIVWGASQMSFGAVGMLAVMAFAAHDAAGRALGVVQVGFSLGLMSGPVVFGYLVDLSGRYDAGFAFVLGVLTTAMLLTALWRRSTARAAKPTRP